MSNVLKFPTPPYIATLQEQIKQEHMTWQSAFDWLQEQGMNAKIAKKLLGPSGDEVDSPAETV
jgi:hypothetical protein